jgi:hypothetical protein
MKKNVFSILYIALALLLCLTPSLGLLVFGESGAAAKQVLAPRPELRDRDGGWNLSVLNDSADWLADHFALRQQLVNLWSRLNTELLASSPEEQVILGREGWLYYAPTLPDYCGQALSDEELSAVAARLAALQTQAESRGARFLLVVAPNKNSLYPQYMPAAYPENHAESNWEKLRPLLDRAGVAYVDLFALPLPYYRTDTHWTAEGAAMAADAILAALDRTGSYAHCPFAEGELRPGDLYEMLYPASSGAEREILCQRGLDFDHLNDPREGNAIRIRTHSARPGSLYCWRDSFGVALYPYLADAFGQACFSRSTDYTLPEEDYDVVILEIVERSIPTLVPDT